MAAGWWYANRAAGLVAWALLSASMVVGLLLSSKALGKRPRANWLTDLHRGLSGLAVAFVGVHVAAAIGDSYVHFGATEILVPFTSSWRPLAIAWGVVSMYLLIAVEASSLMRKRLSKAVWRKIHFLSFPLFVTATVHGVTAGSELGTTAGIAAAALATAAITTLTALRIMDEVAKAKQPPPPPRVPPLVVPTGPPQMPTEPPTRVPVGSSF